MPRHSFDFETTCEQAIFEVLRDSVEPLFLHQIIRKAAPVGQWCESSYDVALQRLVRRGIILRLHRSTPTTYTLPMVGAGAVYGSARSVRSASFRHAGQKKDRGEAASAVVARESASAESREAPARCPWECELV